MNSEDHNMLDFLSNISWELLLFILILLVWSIAVILADKSGKLKKYNMDRIWYIALMWRTKKGRKLIDRIASPKQMWMRISTVGFVFFFIGMILMIILVALSAWIASTSPLVKPVGAEEVLVLPGINPYVPFVYGLIGLIIAVVAHEFSHGIIARVMDFKVKALGLLFILVPIGAFMEPDDEEVNKGPRIARMRMFAAGPIMNFILAFLFIGLFSFGMMGSVEADDDPLIITDVSKVSPLHISLDDNPKALYSINNSDISSLSDLYEYNLSTPGEWIPIEMKMNGGRFQIPMIAGVIITGIGEDTPAEDAGINTGSIIYSLNGIMVNGSESFSEMMDETEKGQIINLTLLVPERDENDEIITSKKSPEFENSNNGEYEGIGFYPNYTKKSYQVELDDKYDYYRMNRYKGKGYIGITSSFLGVSGIGSEEFIEVLNRPIHSAKGLPAKFANVVYITFRLPIELEKMPFHDPLTDIYDIKGPLSFLPESIFWFTANTLFYTFWLNILLGLFNALPMVPLDGGFVFRDTTVLILKKFFKDKKEEKLEKIAKTISTAASLLILFMIILSILGPRIQLLF
jgi:membrane-associated protease RseP (regulator of RpoE activity)